MSDVVYQTITLSVTAANAQAGNKLTVTLTKRNNKDVAWSTGPNFSTSAGITLTSVGGAAVPVSRFSITNAEVVCSLAPSDSGSATQFNADAYLVAVADIDMFGLTLDANEGCTVTATLPGRLPIPLSESVTWIDWTQQ